MYIETDIEASFAERENFSRKDKKVLNVRRSNLVKDALAKCKLFFQGGIKPIPVKFVEDPNTIDAGGH